MPNVRECNCLRGVAPLFVFAFVPEDVVVGVAVPRWVEVNQIGQAHINGHAFCAVGEDFRVVPVVPLPQVIEAVAVIPCPRLHFRFLGRHSIYSFCCLKLFDERQNNP